MAFLGIDIEKAAVLATMLGQRADLLEETRANVAIAESVAAFRSDAIPVLDDARSELLLARSQIVWAIGVLQAFKLQTAWSVPGLVRRPGGGEATPADVAKPWNEVTQEASHNSFAVEGGISALYAHGIRTFELDIHRGPPFEERVSNGVRSYIPGLGSGPADDWRVYHHSGDSSSEYRMLREALTQVAALDSHDVITIFIDNKDPFKDGLDAGALDQILAEIFEDKLFRPGDLLARVQGAETLRQSVAEAGWPTAAQLAGRVIVVLTDNTDDYDPVAGAAFVAGRPNLQEVDGVWVHYAAEDIVFVNVNTHDVSDAQIAAIAATGDLVRTYFGERCDPLRLWPPNYRAVDHEFPEEACAYP